MTMITESSAPQLEQPNSIKEINQKARYCWYNNPLQWPEPTVYNWVIHAVTWLIWFVLSIHFTNILAVMMFAAYVPLIISTAKLSAWLFDWRMIKLPDGEFWMNVPGKVTYLTVRVKVSHAVSENQYDVHTSYRIVDDKEGEEILYYSRKRRYKSVPRWVEENESIQFRVLKRNTAFATVIDQRIEYEENEQQDSSILRWNDDGDENYPSKCKLVRIISLFSVGVSVVLLPVLDGVLADNPISIFFLLWMVCLLSWGCYLITALHVDKSKYTALWEETVNA